MRTRFRLLIIILTYFSLCIVYSVVTPPWEASDEWAHFDYVVFMKEEQRLPSQAEIYADPTRQLKQLPAYYITGAVLLTPFDLSSFDRPELNPWLFFPASGHNWAVHLDDGSTTPSSTLAALHFLRITSAMWGTITLMFIFMTTHLFTGHRNVALLATMFAAFNPRFIFSSSTVSNDIFVTMWVSVVVYFIVRLLLRQFHWTSVAGLMIGLAGALLSKSNAIAVIPMVGLAGLYLIVRQLIRMKYSMKQIAMITGMMLVLAMLAPILYVLFALDSQGRPEPNLTSIDELLTAYSDPASLQWHRILPAFEHGYMGYWGQFGYSTIELPSTWLVLIGVFCIMMLAGTIAYLRHTNRDNRALLIIFASLFATFCAVPLIFVLESGYIFLFHGRYLLPTIGVVVITLAIGWSWLNSRFQLPQVLFYSPAAGLLLLSFQAPFTLIYPAYLPPGLIDTIPEHHTGTNLQFGDTIELISYHAPSEVSSGDELVVDLCWHALQQPEENYTVEVILLDNNLEQLVSRKALPGNGNYPTQNWETGIRFCDTHPLTVPEHDTYASKGYVALSIYAYSTQTETITTRLSALDSSQNPIPTSLITELKLNGKRPRQFADEAAAEQVCNTLLDNTTYEFPQEGIALTIESIEQANNTIKLGFCWQVEQDVQNNYLLFAHVLDETGMIVAQGDGLPLDGTYPTSMWGTGDRISESRRIALNDDVPSGQIQLALGLYQAGGTRLAITTTDGTQLINDAILIDLPPRE